MNIKRRYRIITEWSNREMGVFYSPEKKVKTLCGLKWVPLTGFMYASLEDAKTQIRKAKLKENFKSQIIKL